MKKGDRESDSEFLESDDPDDDTFNKSIKINRSKESISSSNKKELLADYYSLICYILIKEISFKLYLEDDNEKKPNMFTPFVELILKETQTIFYKKLDSSNETRIVIANMELFEIPFIRNNYNKSNKNLNSNSTFKILSEFTQDIITGEIEDFENDDALNKEDKRKYIRRKSLRESTIKQEKLFKVNANNNKKVNNKEYEDLKNYLLLKQHISHKNLALMAEDYCNNSDLNNNINESNINININNSQSKLRTSKKKPTIKVTKNDNKMYDEKMSEEFMNKTYTLIKNCNVIPYKEMISKSTKNQTDILIIIDSNREKFFELKLNGFKLIMRIDIFQLCRYFFLESFPFYDKDSIDLPNLFDPDEDNKPGMTIFVKLNHPIICFLTDDIDNEEQELICIKSEVTFGIKNEKMSKIKEKLINKYKELFDEFQNTKDIKQKKKY